MTQDGGAFFGGFLSKDLHNQLGEDDKKSFDGSHSNSQTDI